MKKQSKIFLAIIILLVSFSFSAPVFSADKVKRADIYKELPLKDSDDIGFLLNKLMIAFICVGCSALFLYFVISFYKKFFVVKEDESKNEVDYEATLFTPEDEESAIKEFLYKFK